MLSNLGCTVAHSGASETPIGFFAALRSRATSEEVAGGNSCAAIRIVLPFETAPDFGFVFAPLPPRGAR